MPSTSDDDAVAFDRPDGNGDDRGWDPRFLLVSGLQFLCYANYNMLQPVLALYLASLGHSPAFVGLVVGAFGFASVTTRPYIGRSVDEWSPVKTYLSGTAAIALGTFGYLVATTPTLLASRIIHGTGWAAVNTAGPSIALSNAPETSRGAAIGYFNAFRQITLPLAPAVGLWAADALGVAAVFLVAGGLAVTATVFAPFLRDRRQIPKPASERGQGGRLIETRALLPAAIQTLLYCSAPLIFVFMPLLARDRAIGGLPLFFVVAGVVSIGFQPLARFSDTWGRGPNIALGLMLVAAGLVVLANAGTLPPLIIGGALWAGGIALVEPATTALTVDSVPESRRGAALATYSAAFQVGQGAGGLVCGLAISLVGYTWTFFGAVVLVVAAGLLLGAKWTQVMQRPG